MSESTITYQITEPSRDTIYVQWRVRKALGYLISDNMTVDGLANRILEEWLDKNARDIVEHLGKMREMDNEFRKGLKKG